MKLMMIDIPDKIYDTIQDDQVITREQLLVLQNCILRGSLMSRIIKYRAKHFVAYNDDWLKENWEMEMKLLGVDFSKHDEEVIKETVASVWGKPPYTEVLDSIKTEIENDWQLRDFPASPFSCGLRHALEIINKYKKGDKE